MVTRTVEVPLTVTGTVNVAMAVAKTVIGTMTVTKKVKLPVTRLESITSAKRVFWAVTGITMGLYRLTRLI